MDSITFVTCIYYYYSLTFITETTHFTNCISYCEKVNFNRKNTKNIYKLQKKQSSLVSRDTHNYRSLWVQSLIKRIKTTYLFDYRKTMILHLVTTGYIMVRKHDNSNRYKCNKFTGTSSLIRI